MASKWEYMEVGCGVYQSILDTIKPYTDQGWEALNINDRISGGGRAGTIAWLRRYIGPKIVIKQHTVLDEPSDIYSLD
jgi:hypothetical protein